MQSDSSCSCECVRARVRAGLLTQHEQQSDDVDQDHVESGGNPTGHADGSASVSRAVRSGSLALSPRCASHSLPVNSDMLEASRYPWRRCNGESLDHLHPHLLLLRLLGGLRPARSPLWTTYSGAAARVGVSTVHPVTWKHFSSLNIHELRRVTPTFPRCSLARFGWCDTGTGVWTSDSFRSRLFPLCPLTVTSPTLIIMMMLKITRICGTR